MANLGLRPFARDIKLSHSIFALPFAATALLLAPATAWTLGKVLWLLVCMVAARTFAMGMNRYIDRHIDARNPRTAMRMIPSGALSPAQCLGWSLGAAVVFVFAAQSLSPVAGGFSVPVLGLLALYSLSKRFTRWSHFVLGSCLALAPMGVTVALTGTLSASALLLGLVLVLWTAGFDIIYATQDVGFDRGEGLHSLPADLGVLASIRLSRILFAGVVVTLLTLGLWEGMGFFYYGGVVAITAILFWEHWLVRGVGEDQADGAAIHRAFFTVNSWVGVILYVACQGDLLLR